LKNAIARINDAARGPYAANKIVEKNAGIPTKKEAKGAAEQKRLKDKERVVVGLKSFKMKRVDQNHHPIVEPKAEVKYKYPTPKDDFIEDQRNPYVLKMTDQLKQVNKYIALWNGKIRDGSMSEQSIKTLTDRVKGARRFKKALLEVLKDFGVTEPKEISADRFAMRKRDRAAQFDRKFAYNVSKMIARTAHALERSHGKKRVYLRNKLNTLRHARQNASLKKDSSTA